MTARIRSYHGPAGGWGSAGSVMTVLFRDRARLGTLRVLASQNKPGGAMCTSCAWAKPAVPHPLEFCENGVKATVWETTANRADAAFFAAHTLTELEGWSDHALEAEGRLTEPMRYDVTSDRYLPVSWNEAFADIGARLKTMAPETVEFYVSGRASLETSYMWQLFARLYGSNNLPDSSNMCHESSSVGLPESIGAAVGTATLSDFENCDTIFYIGQNVATSSPRLLHQLQDAVKRGVRIVTLNPLRERGLERFVNPQAPLEMLTNDATQISHRYYQLRNGGDIAALFGICKALIEADDAFRLSAGEIVPSDADATAKSSAAAVAFAASMAAAETKNVLDHGFIADHTQGFPAFATAARGHDWATLEAISGLSRAEMEEAARIYADSRAVLICYGMGLTQHLLGVENVHMVANLAMMRGNIGKPGGNICAVRGHSNVQGQRTVGITEKPELAPLGRLAELYDFDPPRGEGHATVAACRAMIDGSASGFIALGGNFLRAVPDSEAVEAGWRNLPLTVQIATKLNRSHVIHGHAAYLLPCLGRLEIDRQASGEQAVTIESSVAQFHASRGKAAPASPHLLSEPAIVAGLAKTTLTRGNVPWDAWVGDYGLVREAIEATYPETFRNFNTRVFHPGGMPRPLPARERSWATRTGKAQFLTPDRLCPDGFLEAAAGVLNLMTLRSNDQYNTTVYGFSDRFRGVEGTRRVIFLNRDDMAAQGIAEGEEVDLVTAAGERSRRVEAFRATGYDMPRGSCGAYFPETNPLFPLDHHNEKALTPAYKLLPIRVERRTVR